MGNSESAMRRMKIYNSKDVKRKEDVGEKSIEEKE